MKFIEYLSISYFIFFILCDFEKFRYQVYNIEEIKLHPKFNLFGLYFDNDQNLSPLVSF